MIKKAKVIEACNLLTLDELKQLRLYLFPEPMTFLRRTFLNSGELGELSGMPLDTESSSCSYPIYGKTADRPDTIDIQVLQPPIVYPEDVADEISDDGYRPRRPVGGMKVFHHRDPEFGDSYILRKGSVGVLVEIDLPRNKHVKHKTLLQRVAANVPKQQRRLDGPGEFSLDSPIFPGRVVRACAVTTIEDIRALSSDGKVSVFVEESLGTAVGVVTGDGYSDNYIETNCTRSTPEIVATSLHLSVMTYRTERGARESMAFLDEAGEAKPTEEGIGDESVVSRSSLGDYTLEFRSANVVMSISLGQGLARLGDPYEAAKTLTPIAQKIVKRVQRG